MASPLSPLTGPRRQLPWLGLFALCFGIGLMLLYFFKPGVSRDGNLFATVFYLGTGGVLALWGLGAVLGELWPALTVLRGGHGRRYRVKMPMQAVVYLVILFTLFFGALVGRSNMMMLVFGLMAGPFVLNGSITFSMLKGTQAQRRLPERVLAGELFTVELLLANRKRLFSSWMMIVEDRLVGAVERLSAAVLFTRVPPRSEHAGLYQARLVHRGKYLFGPLHVISRFPMGLMERAVVIDQFDSLLVYPRLGVLSATWYQQAAASNEIVQRPQTRRGAFDDEFHRLREYRSGDNPRAIHWRTSARRNELMVREYRQSRDQDLLVLLDLWIPPVPSDADRARVELAVSFAATLCVEQCRQTGDCLLLLGISGDQTTHCEGPASHLTMDAFLERLALAEAGDSRRLSELRQEMAPMCGPAMRSILVTSRSPDPATMAELSTSEETMPVPLVISTDSEEFAAIFQFAPPDDARSVDPGVD